MINATGLSFRLLDHVVALIMLEYRSVLPITMNGAMLYKQTEVPTSARYAAWREPGYFTTLRPTLEHSPRTLRALS